MTVIYGRSFRAIERKRERVRGEDRFGALQQHCAPPNDIATRERGDCSALPSHARVVFAIASSLFVSVCSCSFVWERKRQCSTRVPVY